MTSDAALATLRCGINPTDRASLEEIPCRILMAIHIWKANLQELLSYEHP